MMATLGNQPPVTIEAQIIMGDGTTVYDRVFDKPTRSNTYNVSPFALEVDLTAFNSRPGNKDAYAEKSLREMAETLRDEGQLQPVTAVRRKGTRSLLVVYGNRRTMGARYGIEKSILPPDWTIRYEVMDGDETDAKRLFLKNLIENHGRADLTPMDHAGNIARLKGFGLSHAEIAAKLNRTKAWVSGMLRLPELPERWRGMVSDGAMPADVGINLARLPEQKAESVMAFIAREQLPVNMASFKRALRELDTAAPAKEPRAKMGRSIREIRAWAESLGDAGAPLLSFVNGGDPEELRARLNCFQERMAAFAEEEQLVSE